MSGELIEGDFVGRVVSGQFGANRNGHPVIWAELEVTEGPHRGRKIPYQGRLDERSISYTKRDMLALGWQGVTSETFVPDVAAKAASGDVVDFTIEIAVWNKPDGSVKKWSTVRSIGASQPVLDPPDARMIAKVDEWLRMTDAVAPPASSSSQRQDDIPF
jgi:hypothetical protein